MRFYLFTYKPNIQPSAIQVSTYLQQVKYVFTQKDEQQYILSIMSGLLTLLVRFCVVGTFVICIYTVTVNSLLLKM